MALVIAETQFITKQDSGLAAVDIYENLGRGESVEPVVGSALPIGTKTPNLTGAIGKLTDEFNGLFKTAASASSAHERIKQMIDNRKNIVGDIKEAITKDAFAYIGLGDQAGTLTDIIAGKRDPSELIGMVAGLDPSLEVIVNGVTDIIKADSFDNVNGVLSLLGEITGNPDTGKVVDLSADFLMYSTLFEEATALRIPSLVDELITQMGVDQTRKVMLSGIPRVTKNSDVVTLDKITKVVGASALQVSHPTIVTSLLSNYQTVSNRPPTAEETTELKDLLDKIDPKWYLYEREGVDTINLTVLEDLSGHAYQALSQMEELSEVIGLAGLYKAEPLSVILHDTKPWIKNL